MTSKYFKAGFFALGVISAGGTLPVSAQLPSMTKKELLGYFISATNKGMEFKIASDGKTIIRVLHSKSEPIAKTLDIPVTFSVEETLPNEKVARRKILPESLESTHPPTEKPKDLTFKGKMTGDIPFEVTVSEERGGILLGGRLLNPGGTKNPTRFFIEVGIPNAKSKETSNAEKNKKAAKELEKQMKNDKVMLVWTDGKKAKITGDESVEGASKEVTGPGIASASIDFSAFKGRQIELVAAPNSSMRLDNQNKRPLPEGFDLVWTADPAKDPQGKAQLSIMAK